MGIGALVQERLVDLVKVSGIPVCREIAAQARGHAKTPPKPLVGGFIRWGFREDSQLCDGQSVAANNVPTLIADQVSGGN